jgi:hypothetical protein
MQVSYKIVQTISGTMIATCPSDIVAWAEASERRVVGLATSKRLRNELQGQPIISGLCGPMWDGYDAISGKPVIRYEDQASNDILSI